jgi:hypothetical protein
MAQVKCGIQRVSGILVGGSGDILAFGPFPKGTLVREVHVMFENQLVGVAMQGHLAMAMGGLCPADEAEFFAFSRQLFQNEKISGLPIILWGSTSVFVGTTDSYPSDAGFRRFQFPLNVEIDDQPYLAVLIRNVSGTFDWHVAVDALPPHGRGFLDQ